MARSLKAGTRMASLVSPSDGMDHYLGSNEHLAYHANLHVMPGMLRKGSCGDGVCLAVGRLLASPLLQRLTDVSHSSLVLFLLEQDIDLDRDTPPDSLCIALPCAPPRAHTRLGLCPRAACLAFVVHLSHARVCVPVGVQVRCVLAILGGQDKFREHVSNVELLSALVCLSEGIIRQLYEDYPAFPLDALTSDVSTEAHLFRRRDGTEQGGYLEFWQVRRSHSM